MSFVSVSATRRLRWRELPCLPRRRATRSDIAAAGDNEDEDEDDDAAETMAKPTPIASALPYARKCECAASTPRIDAGASDEMGSAGNEDEDEVEDEVEAAADDKVAALADGASCDDESARARFDADAAVGAAASVLAADFLTVRGGAVDASVPGMGTRCMTAALRSASAARHRDSAVCVCVCVCMFGRGDICKMQKSTQVDAIILLERAYLIQHHTQNLCTALTA